MSKEIYNKEGQTRFGNSLPQTSEELSNEALSRESMLYSYQNSVDTVFLGDHRVYSLKFNKYLDTKSKVYDPVTTKYIDIPIKYGAPNIIFSDDTGITGKVPEASLHQRPQLPLISFFLTGIAPDFSRTVDPCVRQRFKPLKVAPPNDGDATPSIAEGQSKYLVSHSPMPVTYSFQVDVWTEYREHLQQLQLMFLADFNPYSYLYDIYDFEDETQRTFYRPYAKMTMEGGFKDNSQLVLGSDRRIIRGTCNINVEGWTTPPVKQVGVVHRIIPTVGE